MSFIRKPKDGENDLSTMPMPMAEPEASPGPVRTVIRDKGRQFFGVETPVGIDLTDIYTQLTQIKGQQTEMKSLLDGLSNGSNETLPLVKQLKSLDLTVGDNISKIKTLLTNLGDPAGYTKCYNDDTAIKINPNVKIAIAGEVRNITQPTGGTAATQSGGGTGTQASQVTSPGGVQQLPQSIGPFGVIKRPRLFKPEPLSMELDASGGTGTGTFSSTRSPFEKSMKSLSEGKAIYCQLGHFGRRFDVLNQQLGGLETKIPTSDQMNSIKDGLNKFSNIYDTINLSFGFADPKQWFEKVNNDLKNLPTIMSDNSKSRFDIASLGSNFTNLSNRLTNLEFNLSDTIKAQMSTLKLSIPTGEWNTQVGSRITNFDWTLMNGKDKWNSSLDSFVTTKGLSALGGLTLRQKLDELANMATAGASGLIGDLKPDLGTLKNIVSSIDGNLIDIKKKFNELTNGASLNFGGIRTRATGLKDKIGSGDGFGIRKKLTDIKASLDNLIDGTPVAMRYFGYVDTSQSKWHDVFYSHLEIADTVDLLPKDYTLENGKMVGVSGVGKYGFYKTKEYARIADALAGVKDFTNEVVGAAESNASWSAGSAGPDAYLGVAREQTEGVRKFITKKIKEKGSDKLDDAKTDVKNLLPDLTSIDGLTNIKLPGIFTSGELASKLPANFGTLFSKL